MEINKVSKNDEEFVNSGTKDMAKLYEKLWHISEKNTDEPKTVMFYILLSTIKTILYNMGDTVDSRLYQDLLIDYMTYAHGSIQPYDEDEYLMKNKFYDKQKEKNE